MCSWCSVLAYKRRRRSSRLFFTPQEHGFPVTRGTNFWQLLRLNPVWKVKETYRHSEKGKDCTGEEFLFTSLQPFQCFPYTHHRGAVWCHSVLFQNAKSLSIIEYYKTKITLASASGSWWKEVGCRIQAQKVQLEYFQIFLSFAHCLLHVCSQKLVHS